MMLMLRKEGVYAERCSCGTFCMVRPHRRPLAARASTTLVLPTTPPPFALVVHTSGLYVPILLVAQGQKDAFALVSTIGFGVTIGAPGENLLPAPCDLPAARRDLLIC